MKPTLKPPGTKRLKLKCDILLSTSAFKSKLHHYTTAWRAAPATYGAAAVSTYGNNGETYWGSSNVSCVAPAATSGQGRAVQVDPLKPMLKAPGNKRL
jgi:hypothetical protein